MATEDISHIIKRSNLTTRGQLKALQTKGEDTLLNKQSPRLPENLFLAIASCFDLWLCGECLQTHVFILCSSSSSTSAYRLDGPAPVIVTCVYA